MKLLIPIFLFLLTLRAAAEDVTPFPPGADLVMKNYEREVAAARDRAVKQLQSLLVSETQRGKLDSALAIKSTIATLSLSGGAAAGTPAVPLKTGNVAIKANAKLGAELGSVTAGMRLKLQYVEGRWAMSGGGAGDPTKWPNPDDADVYSGNRMGIFSVIDGEAKLLAQVPGGTKKKAFHYRFEKDYPMVILRILDSDPADNPGFVIYNVEVTK